MLLYKVSDFSEDVGSSSLYGGVGFWGEVLLVCFLFSFPRHLASHCLIATLLLKNLR